MLLDLLDQALRSVIPFGDLDGQEMGVALVVGGIQSEHRILLGSGEVVIAVGDLHRGDTGLDHVFVGMSEAIEEVSGGLLGVFSEAGVDIDEMGAEIVGVGDGVLSVDFVRFDVEHRIRRSRIRRSRIGYC